LPNAGILPYDAKTSCF